MRHLALLYDSMFNTPNLIKALENLSDDDISDYKWLDRRFNQIVARYKAWEMMRT